MTPAGSSRVTLSRFLGAALPFLAGAALRLWNLRGQILGGDEIHALRAAVSFPLPKILVTYQQTDNCIPLTALYKVLMGWGLPGTEMFFRLPVLLCGLAALLALPAAFAGRVSDSTVLLYRWLLALSPALVLYSRIARSYMPMVCLAFGAAMAFEAWWRTRSRRAGAAYVLLGGLAVWFHLGAGPAVAAPFLFAVGDLAVRRKDVRKGLRDLILLGLALVSAFALFLVPARESLLALIAGKRSEQAVPWSGVVPALFRLQAGTHWAWVAALFGVAALAGFVVLFRNDRRLALFTATVVVGHVAGILILSPMGLASPYDFRAVSPACPSLRAALGGRGRGEGNKDGQGQARTDKDQARSGEGFRRHPVSPDSLCRRSLCRSSVSSHVVPAPQRFRGLLPSSEDAAGGCGAGVLPPASR